MVPGRGVVAAQIATVDVCTVRSSPDFSLDSLRGECIALLASYSQPTRHFLVGCVGGCAAYLRSGYMFTLSPRFVMYLCAGFVRFDWQGRGSCPVSLT